MGLILLFGIFLGAMVAGVPVAFALRLFGKDPMHRRPDPDASTYWLDKADGRPDRGSLERYF